MDWFVTSLQHYPELSIYLALAVGFWFGSIKFGSFKLGSVTGTLLMGVLIGQLDIKISPNVKAVFFLLFLFAVGYGVGPQFFKGLKKEGLPQALFAAITVVLTLVVTWLTAKFFGFDIGTAAGLMAGAQTSSAIIGVASDTISQLGLDAAMQKKMADAIPIAYAVTYIFGTAGTAYILASVGPKLLGINLPKSAKELESKMGTAELAPGVVPGYHPLALRAYRVDNDAIDGMTVENFEKEFVILTHKRGYVGRLRRGNELINTELSTVMRKGDVIALSANREVLVKSDLPRVGPEVNDSELLNVHVEIMNVVVTKKEMAGKTLKELSDAPISRGIFLRKIMKNGIELPLTSETRIDRGDIVTLVGSESSVEKAVKLIGYADRPSNTTDIVFLALGIFIGGLLGSLVLKFGDVPLTMGTAGGSLIAGLIFGWLRSVKPMFGRIPSGSLWLMNNLGLNAFIAVIGITAGPGFVSGLQSLGVNLFLAGIISTTIPLIIAIYIGKYFFKFHPAINLGCVAGARTTTAAIGAITEKAESNTPALGYTVTYAVGQILLTLCGVVIVLLMK
ncbi:MAG: aspartate-alanine antiporter [Ignavibacteriae bacterium]|nr:aspartate-alanine antiporter [Ignavibacteriota bacterium]